MRMNAGCYQFDRISFIVSFQIHLILFMADRRFELYNKNIILQILFLLKKRLEAIIAHFYDGSYIIKNLYEYLLSVRNHVNQKQLVRFYLIVWGDLISQLKALNQKNYRS